MDGMNLPAPGVTLKEFEEDCENPEAVQRDVLRRILEHSKETVHLKGLGITGDTTVDDFRRLHPVTDYSFYESYIDSISSGEKEPNLLLEGLTGFNLSSGTTGKASKMIPATMAGTIGTLDFMSLVNDLMERFGFLRSERAASCCRSGKRITTPSGHIAAGLSTRLLHHPAAGPILAATAISPIKVYNIPEHVPCMYAHGLCALIRRKEVVKITSSYCAMVVDLLVAIQDRWEDMIQHIRTGVAPSDDVAEVDEAVGSLLKPEGDPGLADELEAALGPDRGAGSGSRRDRFRGWFLNNPQEEEGPSEGQGGGGEGQTGATPASGSIPIWSPMYVASEGWMGVNTDVTESERPAEKAVYTLYPKFVFFEFLPVSRPISALSVPTPPGESQEGRVQGGGEAEKVAADPVLVHELKVGCQYEVMVTNYQGFYRYRLKDIVEVVGFKGKMPRVAFVAREGALLNARSERTSEPTLMQALSDGIKAVNASPQAPCSGDRLGPAVALLDFTSRVECEANPPRYGISVELGGLGHLEPGELERSLRELATAIDVALKQLNYVYCADRKVGLTGPPRVELVAPDTFQRYKATVVARGADPSQYKTPRLILSSIMAEFISQYITASAVAEES